MVDLGQDVFLHHDLFLLIFLKDEVFFQDLDRIKLSIYLVPSQDDLSIGTSTDNRDRVEQFH